MENEPLEIEPFLSDLESRLERLRALYDQWFAGIERCEPQVPRKDVERRIALLRKQPLRNTALRFRFQTLLQRWTTYLTYWNRVGRQIEEGTYKREIQRGKKAKGATVPETPKPIVQEAAPVPEEAPPPAPPVERPAPPVRPATSSTSAFGAFLRQSATKAVDSLPPRESIEPPPSKAVSPPEAVPSVPAPATRPETRKSRPPVRAPSPPPVPATARRGPPPVPSKRPSRAPSKPPPPLGATARPKPPPLPPAKSTSQDQGMRQLYERYSEAQRKNNERPVSFETVAKSVREMEPKLRAKYGGKPVDFEVIVQDGKVGLKPVPKK